MEKSGKPYAEALKEAQQKGYAETNPASDVNGSDAEAKLLLLSLVGFGLEIQPGKIWRKGIEDIQPVDFRYAKRIGNSTIKQLAVARRKGRSVQVRPRLGFGGKFSRQCRRRDECGLFRRQEQQRRAWRARLRLRFGWSRRRRRADRSGGARRRLRAGARRAQV
jgi:hypothetical protein